MIFKWNDRFCTGIEEIDKQHKKLFEIGSELYSLALLQDGQDHYDEIMMLIYELKDYTVYHFNYEEYYMDKYSFIEMKEHKQEHSSFIDKVSELEFQDIDMGQKKVILEIIEFIANWISNHIIKKDLKYKDTFAQNRE